MKLELSVINRDIIILIVVDILMMFILFCTVHYMLIMLYV